MRIRHNQCKIKLIRGTVAHAGHLDLFTSIGTDPHQNRVAFFVYFNSFANSVQPNFCITLFFSAINRSSFAGAVVIHDFFWGLIFPGLGQPFYGSPILFTSQYGTPIISCISYSFWYIRSVFLKFRVSAYVVFGSDRNKAIGSEKSMHFESM